MGLFVVFEDVAWLATESAPAKREVADWLVETGFHRWLAEPRGEAQDASEERLRVEFALGDDGGMNLDLKLKGTRGQRVPFYSLKSVEYVPDVGLLHRPEQ